ncbi:NUDIX domain-containing protein [Fonticella tunisiensis]|uniref:8-oxo-dGTP diphosphatase n=1 Tax=Fonticella tunisiensis TaxID=1096341 RepID=A0A4R7KQT5_9CLOT|nr:8-oxo-dGTP diphosphatase [Fonticella tunisiensis]TDT60943.1 8-oxo-dGTP diphosphatase [Fonticella tunisiensis]
MDRLIETIRRSSIQKVAAICYIVKYGKTLMLDRVKEPFSGYLVAPGGKKENNEDILSCIKREMYEETGIDIKEPELKVVTTEIGPDNYNWILYIFICDKFTGEVKESNEGKLVWVDIDRLDEERLNKIDKDLLPYVFSNKKYLIYLSYDEQKNCTIESIEELNL